MVHVDGGAERGEGGGYASACLHLPTQEAKEDHSGASFLVAGPPGWWLLVLYVYKDPYDGANAPRSPCGSICAGTASLCSSASLSRGRHVTSPRMRIAPHIGLHHRVTFWRARETAAANAGTIVSTIFHPQVTTANAGRWDSENYSSKPDSFLLRLNLRNRLNLN